MPLIPIGTSGTVSICFNDDVPGSHKAIEVGNRLASSCEFEAAILLRLIRMIGPGITNLLDAPMALTCFDPGTGE